MADPKTVRLAHVLMLQREKHGDSQDGDVRGYKGQVFRCLGSEPYVNRKGTHMMLNRWQSFCMECGASFTLLHQQRGEFQPTRRCPAHRKNKP